MLKKILSLIKVPPLQVAARCDRTTSRRHWFFSSFLGGQL